MLLFFFHQPPSRESKDTFQDTAKLLYPGTLQGRADRHISANPNQYSIQYGPPRPQKPTKPFKPTIDACSNDDSDHDYEDICEQFQETTHKMSGATIKH